MNIPFRLKVEDLESVFLESAEHAGLYNLKGHSVGGMRASISTRCSCKLGRRACQVYERL